MENLGVQRIGQSINSSIWCTKNSYTMTVGGSLISTFFTSAASFFSHFSLFSFISIFCVFLSLSGKPHNTIHQNSATLFCHHQNYPQKKTHIPEPPPPSLEQPTTNPSEKQSHTHTSATDSTPPPPPNPATTESTQRTKPQTHGQTNFSNLRPTPPQSYPLLKSQTKYQTHGKEKNEGSLSRKIIENKFRIWRGDEILRQRNRVRKRASSR